MNDSCGQGITLNDTIMENKQTNKLDFSFILFNFLPTKTPQRKIQHEFDTRVAT